jgi:hypothetical protein
MVEFDFVIDSSSKRGEFVHDHDLDRPTADSYQMRLVVQSWVVGVGR